MKSLHHSYLADPPLASLYSGSERVAIEVALNDLRLQRRGALRRALIRRLHARRR